MLGIQTPILMDGLDKRHLLIDINCVFMTSKWLIKQYNILKMQQIL